MNYFTLEGWEHPDMDEVCRKVFSQGFQANLQSFITRPYADRDKKVSYERNAVWKFGEDAKINFCVNSHNIFMINVLLRDISDKDREDYFRSAFISRIEDLEYWINKRAVNFDLLILGRGLYWMGLDFENVRILGATRHDQMDWDAERILSWQQSPEMWSSRPDCLITE